MQLPLYNYHIPSFFVVNKPHLYSAFTSKMLFDKLFVLLAIIVASSFSFPAAEEHQDNDYGMANQDDFKLDSNDEELQLGEFE